MKPANILIDEDDNPLITDLGLAKNTSGGSDLTNTGAILGTPSYMPPEQASGNRTVTMAADIYALGAVMYELLTGQPPYEGSSAVDTVMQVLQSPPQPPRKKGPSVNSDLELICMKCLGRDPDKRFASAADLANDLGNWLLDEPISVKRPSFTSLASRWIRRNHRYVYFGFAVLMGLSIALPIALVFLAGGFGVVYDQFPDDQRPWVFSIEKMPTWVPRISMALLFFVFWPAIGILNALVIRPTTIRKAIGIGTLTSVLCSSIFCVLMGWAIIVFAAGTNAEMHIETLASAVWPPEDVDQATTMQKATEMFDGLRDIPESKRAHIIADRIVADQVADAPRSLRAIVLCCLILSAPVIYGTVLGQVLLQRRNRFWLVLIRYQFAWVSISVGALIAVVYVIAGKISVNSTPQPALTLPNTVAMIVLVCGLIAFLSLRRWRRDKRSDPSIIKTAT